MRRFSFAGGRPRAFSRGECIWKAHGHRGFRSAVRDFAAVTSVDRWAMSDSWVAAIPQPRSTPTAAGMTARCVGITLPTVAPIANMRIGHGRDVAVDD